MKCSLLLLLLSVICVVYAIPTSETDQSEEASSFELNDYPYVSDDKLNTLKKIIRAYEIIDHQKAAEKKQREPLMMKRGRQCLWKICSWSLDGTKMKKRAI